MMTAGTAFFIRRFVCGHSQCAELASAVHDRIIGANDVASFGENLRRAREARNITLQEIAASTKIGTRALQALEDERFELLPGGIFNKGFVRSYARYVGLDEEQAVADYVIAAKVVPPEVDIQALSTQVHSVPARQSSGMSAATVVGVVAVLVALGVGALWLKELHKEAREQAAAQRQVESAVASSPAPASIPSQMVVPSEPNTTASGAANTAPNGIPSAPPAADQGTATNASANVTQTAAEGLASSKTAGPASKSSAPVEVSVSATARAWISVRSDGKPVETLTLDPDKPESRTRSYNAQERLLLVVGNPAGLVVTYNGKPAGTLGAEGRRATITFTPQGIDKR
jgi:cytoskeletal protein RodZ